MVGEQSGTEKFTFKAPRKQTEGIQEDSGDPRTRPSNLLPSARLHPSFPALLNLAVILWTHLLGQVHQELAISSSPSTDWLTSQAAPNRFKLVRLANHRTSFAGLTFAGFNIYLLRRLSVMCACAFSRKPQKNFHLIVENVYFNFTSRSVHSSASDGGSERYKTQRRGLVQSLDFQRQTFLFSSSLPP